MAQGALAVSDLAEIIPFNTSELTTAEFVAAIQSEDTQTLTNETTRKLFNKQTPPIRKLSMPIFAIQQPLEAGTVHIVERPQKNIDKKNKDIALGISADFPRWLLANTELSRQDALMLAAVCVDGFRLVVGGLRTSYHTPKMSAASLEAPYWPDAYHHHLSLSHPYRAAARIALTALGIEPLELNQIPQPPHIAGLANPLPSQEFRNLYSVLQ